MSARDEYSDTSRDGSGQQQKKDVSVDLPTQILPRTVQEDKDDYPNCLNATRGEADVRK